MKLFPPSQFRNRAQEIAIHQPNDQQAQLYEVTPALASALFLSLPLEARDPNLTEIKVPSDVTVPDVAVLGNAAQGSGFAGEVLRVFVTAAAGVPVDPAVEYTIVTVAPAAGEVEVTYDAAGVPTLTFNAADTVEECEVVMNVLPSNFKAKMAEEVGI